MERSYITDEEHQILKKLADSSQTNDPLNQLFEPVDEIIKLVEAEIRSIHFNCSKVFSIVDSTTDESCLNILSNSNNLLNFSEKISNLEKKLFLYNHLLSKIEDVVSAIEEKKLPYKKVSKIFTSLVNSVFKKKMDTEPSVSLKSINMEQELEEISKI